MAPYIGYDSDTTFIPGTLNTSSSLTIQGGGITQTGGDVNFDSGTLFIDEDLNRVGIGITTPGETLTVDSGTSVGQVVVSRFRGNASGVSGQVVNVLTSNLESGAELQAYSLSTTNSTGALLNLNDAIVLRTSSVTSGGLAFTTANSTAPLIFATDSNERLRITPTGNVGIGATSPNAKLVVSASGTAGMEINPGSPSASSGTLIEHYNRSTALYVQVRTIASEHRFDINAIEALRISTSGNVGIGTTNPGRKLHVIDGDGGGIRIGRSSIADNESSVIDFYYGFNLYYSASIEAIKKSGGDSDLYFYNGTASTKNTSPTLTLINTGNVGIGTTNPDVKLLVNNGTGDSNVLRLLNEEVALVFGTFGTGSSYPRTLTINGTRSDNGTFPKLRIAGQGGIEFAVDLNSVRAVIDASGNVGIGTTNPSGILSLGSSIVDNKLLVYDLTGDKYGFGIRPSQLLVYSGAQGDAGGGILFGKFDGSVFSENVRFTNNGKIGLGITNPEQKLHAYGSGDVSAIFKSTNAGAEISLDSPIGYAALRIFASGAETWRVGNIAQSSNFQIYQLGVGDRLTINNSGNVLIGTTVNYTRLTISNGASSRSGITISDTNTASLMLFAGNAQGAVISTDSIHQALIFKRGSTVGTEDGPETMRISGTGNVGIGTTNPTTRLQVRGSDTVISALITSGNFGSIGITSEEGNDLQLGYARNSSNYGAQTTAGDFSIKTTAPRLHFPIGPGNANSVMVLKSDGNIGVGTTDPQAKLDVFGIIKTSGAGSYISLNNNGYIRGDATGELRFQGGTSGTTFYNAGNSIEFVRIDNSGNVGIGTTAPDGLLTLSGANSNTPRLRIQHPSSDRDAAISTYFDGSGTYLLVGSNHYFSSVGSNTKFDATTGSSGWYLDGSGIGIFYNSSGSGSITERLRITSAGNVGIGTTNPTEKLEVNGNLLIGNPVYNNANRPIIRLGYGSGNLADGTIRGTIQFDSIQDYSVNSGDVWQWKIATIARPGDSGNYNSHFEILRTTRGGVTDYTDFCISRTGSVGIGTTNPGYKLEVNGSFAATTKSFIIPHPTKEGYKLRYGSLEGPENGVYVRGRSNGSVIELPDYWVALVDPDSITVSLTPIGSNMSLGVERIENNKVYIFSENPHPLDYFYMINAERIDVEPLEVEIPPTN